MERTDQFLDATEAEENGVTGVVYNCRWYKPNQDVATDNMEDTALYKEDRIGLKTLKDSGRLVLLEIPGADHLHISEQWFTDNIVKKFF